MKITTAPDLASAIQTETFTLPASWASYLINGDDSGISEEEASECDAFLAKNPHLYPAGCGDQYFKHSNAAGTPAGDVCDYTFISQPI